MRSIGARAPAAVWWRPRSSGPELAGSARWRCEVTSSGSSRTRSTRGWVTGESKPNTHTERPSRLLLDPGGLQIPRDFGNQLTDHLPVRFVFVPETNRGQPVRDVDSA